MCHKMFCKIYSKAVLTIFSFTVSSKSKREYLGEVGVGNSFDGNISNILNVEIIQD